MRFKSDLRRKHDDLSGGQLNKFFSSLQEYLFINV